MTRPVGLLDTNVIVDILRAYSPAISWAQNNPSQILAAPSLVRMELVLGSQDRTEQENVIKLLSPYPLVFPTVLDARQAMEQFEKFNLSHQVEILDCFIGAMRARLRLPVYTRNTKDLSVLDGVSTYVPYT